ncbi:hypothetical protein [Ruegeria atlantica]|uniref:hypothetical protein n=1 Tax=Ruegeria atlantica TaxID=81569 RepID=UPI00147B78B0|nr:hypothetical protein [Ruegeria atlantica]
MLASLAPLSGRGLDVPDGLSYQTPDVWQAVQVFGADMDRVAAKPNTLQTHVLAGYYLDGWDYWFR